MKFIIQIEYSIKIIWHNLGEKDETSIAYKIKVFCIFSTIVSQLFLQLLLLNAFLKIFSICFPES